MHPIDFRNATFSDLKSRLAGQRERVWIAWIAWGPATTRVCAQRAGLSILTFRPRTTELYQMGAVCLSDKSEIINHKSEIPSEGIYRARTDAEWQAWLAEARENAIGKQMQLI